MKNTVIVFLCTIVCIQCVTLQQNLRKKRAWVVDSLTMEEELSGPFPYKLGDLNIEKRVVEEYVIGGEGIDKHPKGILSVELDGSVYALGKVDYEKYKKLTITLTKGNTSVAVEIVVLDVNDHAPVFNREVYEISKDESTSQGEALVTVQASDIDQSHTANSLFTMSIISVSPSTSSVEFFIDQTEGDLIGKISFKGCLDYEEVQKYTILVEAKDHGEKVQLSSTGIVILNIIDKNNHLPEFIGMTDCAGVKAQTDGDIVCRLQVSDKDSRGSAAWKAQYFLQGEKAQHFRIQTDLETNDGLITLTEPLNYEEKSNLSLSVSVKNEEPFFYCRVKGRPKHGLWNVDYTKGRSSFTSMSLPLISVEQDVRNPAVFMKQVAGMERKETGPMLEHSELVMCLSEKMINITAVDPDLHRPSLHFELMGDIEGQWRLQYNRGSSVRLIKESTVYAGDHTLTLKISDSQGQFSFQKLSVHVCDCDLSENCGVHRTFQMNTAAVAAITFSFIVLLGISLMACQVRAKKSTIVSDSTESQYSLSLDIPETERMRQ